MRAREKGLAIMFLNFLDGTFAALAVLPVALVFFLAYGGPRRMTRPSPVRATRRRRRQV